MEGIVGLIGLAMTITEKLIERGRQTGELTPDQDAALVERAVKIFRKATAPAPPPPTGA